MYVILLGPPGAGKGTQAALLAETAGLVHVASGEMFRDNVRRGTDLGKQARSSIEAGALVPDDLTIAMLLERIGRPDAAGGATLDGFPRTIKQAQALDDALAQRGRQVEKVLLIDVGEAELLRRLSGRWSCPDCGAIYHEATNPSRVDGHCDRCGHPLSQRDDDKPSAVKHRLQVYREQTVPLIAYYQRVAKLVRVNGEQGPREVSRDLLAALEAVSA